MKLSLLIEVYDRTELALVTTALDQIEEYRQQPAVTRLERATKPAPEAPVTPSTPVAPPAAAPTAEKAGQGDVEKALREYAQVKGGPAALAVLKTFGASRLTEVPKDRHDELLGALSLAEPAE